MALLARLRVLLLVSLVSTVVGLWSPSSGSAAVSCDLDGFLQPFVTVTGMDSVAITRNASHEILFDPGADGGYLPCGGASTDTTIKLTVNGQPGVPQGVVIDLSGGQFAPGFEPEPDAIPEMEFQLNLKGGSPNIPDAVWVKGTEFRDIMAVAPDGLHLNRG